MLSRISFRFALAGQGKLHELGGHEKQSGIFTAWALGSKSDVISAPASSFLEKQLTYFGAASLLQCPFNLDEDNYVYLRDTIDCGSILFCH